MKKETLKELQKQLDVFSKMKGSDINESIVRKVRNIETKIQRRKKKLAKK